VGFAAGGVLDEGEEVKAKEDRVGEEMGGEFDVLRRGEVSAKVEVRQIDGLKESMRRDDRVEKKIDAGKRSDVGGGDAGRLKPITPSRTAYAAVNVRGEEAEWARDGEGRRGPLLLWDGIEVSGG
jgi:hypothetical protein